MRFLEDLPCVRMEVTLALAAEISTHAGLRLLKWLSSPLLWPEEAMSLWLIGKRSRTTDPLKNNLLVFFLHCILKSLWESDFSSVRLGGTSNGVPPLMVELGWSWTTSVSYGVGEDSFFRGANLRWEWVCSTTKFFSPFWTLLVTVIFCPWGAYWEVAGLCISEYWWLLGKFLGYSKPMLSIRDTL